MEFLSVAGGNRSLLGLSRSGALRDVWRHITPLCNSGVADGQGAPTIRSKPARRQHAGRKTGLCTRNVFADDQVVSALLFCDVKNKRMTVVRVHLGLQSMNLMPIVLRCRQTTSQSLILAELGTRAISNRLGRTFATSTTSSAPDRDRLFRRHS
jgi:hypothetical protein